LERAYQLEKEGTNEIEGGNHGTAWGSFKEIRERGSGKKNVLSEEGGGRREKGRRRRDFVFSLLKGEANQPDGAATPKKQRPTARQKGRGKNHHVSKKN